MVEDGKPFLESKAVEVIATNLTGAKTTLAVNKEAADAGVHDFADLQKFADSSKRRSTASNPATVPDQRP
jgi:glycine betaine/proline transport system substrate-binding protein